MSALSEKFAKGKKALAERAAEQTEPAAAGAQPLTVRPPGAQHGSVTNMKMEMLKSENEALKAGKPSVLIDATLILQSDWANRLGDSFTTPDFAAFKAEIAAAGVNTQPIKVRPVSGSGGTKYEIVYGHRRHRACLELGLKVSAIIDDLDDKELFIEMERENRGRVDLTPYEQGVMYARAIDKKLFSSIRKLAEDINEDPTLVSKSITLARLPDPVLDSFVSRLDVQYRWSTALKSAIEKEPDLISARAADIKKQRAGGGIVSSQMAFDLLVGNSSLITNPAARKVAVGNQTLVITEKKNKVAFVMPTISREKQTRIEKFIAELMAE